MNTDQTIASLQSTGQYAIELTEISCRFGALTALDKINLTVKSGERRAVLGSNGAGKTTLFNVIAGDLPASSGRVKFFGEDITDLPMHERSRNGLRRTYQISQLFGNLSVRDNLYLSCCGPNPGRYVLRRPGSAHPALEMADALLDAIQLNAVAEKPVSELSHGQQRQLEIGLALSGAPRFILFDEPAAGLSQNERDLLIRILHSLPEHIGYIIIEHDMDVALRVAQSVTMMHGGRIFKEGSPAEIETDEQVQKLYLGDAVN